jgi:hypothetical protein
VTSVEPARYQASRKRGHCWSVLPAYTIDGYLPCTGIREGWFNGEAFFRWLADELLPLCSPFPAPKSVIIMDNASIHCNRRIEELITSHGCEVRYLPPYSLDFNPIELSFSVLKAWVRRHFEEIWPHFDGTFGDFLHYAVAKKSLIGFQSSISSIAPGVISLKLILERWKEILKLVLYILISRVYIASFSPI